MLFTVTPLPQFINYYNVKTLIDRPFLSILLFIPLSVILGIGIAGIEKFNNNRIGKHETINILLIPFATLSILLMLFPNNNVLEPLPDVNFVTTNDLFLYQEIKSQLPTNIKILIPNDTPYYELGVDGGAWINYATSRQILKISYNVDLASTEIHQIICAAARAVCIFR